MKAFEILERLKLCSKAMHGGSLNYTVLRLLDRSMEDIRPKPYVGSPLPLSPATVWDFDDKYQLFKKADTCAVFLPQLDEFIQDLETSLNNLKASQQFKSTLASILKKRSATPKELDMLWEAFDALPDYEKEQYLTP